MQAEVGFGHEVMSWSKVLKGVINGGDESNEIGSGSKIAKIINDRATLRYNKEHSLRIAVNLHTAILVVKLESTGHGVEGDKGLAERLLEHSRVKEVVLTAWSVKFISL
ncbi:hypothetical protein GBA52_010106 [Prunus armeniaca]|nr:hypothetical protein GBA52_010106 [Prunus armeniaca]